MNKNYPKIPFLEMLPSDVLGIDELFENLKEMDDIDFPYLVYENNEFSWGYGGEADQSYKELETIILYFRRQRGRFRDDLTQEEGRELSCHAPCGKKGYTYIGGEEEISYVPEDGIECKSCPYSSFTKGPGSPFRVCRNQIKLFLLVKGCCIPQTLYLDPETSQFFANHYLVNNLIAKGLAYSKVVTKISLKNGKPAFQMMGLLEGRHKEFRDFFMDRMKKDDGIYASHFKRSFPYGTLDKCSCNLWKGCTCGMMHRERLAYKNMGY